MENLKPNTAIETKNNESKKEDLSSILNVAPNEKELQSYQEEIDEINKLKEKEISETLKGFNQIHKLFQTEVKLQKEAPSQPDYKNPEHLKNTCQLHLIKKAQELKLAS
jgi:hypothetical protein